jgi:hypothetical protein
LYSILKTFLNYSYSVFFENTKLNLAGKMNISADRRIKSMLYFDILPIIAEVVVCNKYFNFVGGDWLIGL